MPNLKFRPKHRRKRRGAPILVGVLCAAVFSAAAAGIWQLNSTPVQALKPLELDPSVVAAFSSSPQAVAIQAIPSSEPEPSSQEPLPEEASSEPAQSASGQSESAQTPGALEEQPRVTSAYFDDAVFIGDSITTGIKLYDVMSNTTVLASTGIGLENILSKPAIKYGEETLTAMQALAKTGARKVYIMLGANSILGDHDTMVGLYGNLIDEVRRNAPDSIIYVQSVLPINEEIFHVKYNPNTDNSDIMDFNTKLAALAAEKQVYYLDVGSVFRDETGGMPADYTPDGIHINSAQYIMWFDYLKTHAIAAE